MIPRGRIKKPIHITGVRELTQADLAVLAEPRAPLSRIKRIRHSHHRVAEMLGCGFSLGQVALATGYSYERVASLSIDPAIQELASSYRERRSEALADAHAETQRLMMKNLLASQRHISDTYDELDEDSELMPPKTALAIGSDMADRLGFSRHTMQTNVNVDFGRALDNAVRRTAKVIEANAAPALTMKRRI